MISALFGLFPDNENVALSEENTKVVFNFHDALDAFCKSSALLGVKSLTRDDSLSEGGEGVEKMNGHFYKVTSDATEDSLAVVQDVAPKVFKYLKGKVSSLTRSQGSVVIFYQLAEALPYCEGYLDADAFSGYRAQLDAFGQKLVDAGVCKSAEVCVFEHSEPA